MVSTPIVVAGGEIVIRVAQADRESLQLILDRVHGALRPRDVAVDRVVLGDLTVDFAKRKVLSSGSSVSLTTQEFDILRYLAARPNVAVSRTELLRDVWNYVGTPLTRSVDNAIARLRKKVEPCPHKPMFIHTVHRDGYCLMPSCTPD